MVTKREKGRRGINWEFGISRHKLLCIQEIINKVPPYTTGNYIQYLVMNHNEKEYKKGCIYITQSLCCTPETNIILSIDCT